MSSTAVVYFCSKALFASSILDNRFSSASSVSLICYFLFFS
nr:MAG TPA: hypothetical protein [Caudoviricetes sp.]